MGPGPARTLALLSIALLTLLAIVALASRGSTPLLGRDGPAREPSAGFFDYLFTLSIAIGLIGFAIALWGLLTGRSEGLKLERKDTKLIVAVFVCALIVGMAIAARFADLNIRTDGNGPPGGTRTSTAGTETGRAANSREQPDFKFLPFALIAGAGLAAFVVFKAAARRRRRPYAVRTDAELVDELGSLLDDAIDDLRAEPDPRRAVIAAYARTERALAGYGFPRRPFEAPLEYLDRIAAPLHERQPAARRLVFELTHLYERAKFSAHTVDAQMKEEAIGTLVSLRDELRASEAA